MNVLLFGATGMIGHGTLMAALSDKRVSKVLTVGRRATGRTHPKLTELVHADFLDYSAIEDQLSGYDTCLFCLGISSAGMSEEAYRRITYDMTLAAAQTLVKLNPQMTFVYVSGAGTNIDSRTMWARVKGETEAALVDLPFKAAYNARPGFIQSVGEARSRTTLYRAIYAIVSPLYPLLKRLAPTAMIDSDELGRALVEAGLAGAPQSTLEVVDLQQLAAKAAKHHMDVSES